MIWRVALILGLGAALAFVVAARGPKTRAFTDVDGGAPRVVTLEFPDLADEGRDGRSVPLKIHCPVGDGPFPLLVYSHGGLGSWDAHLYEAQFMAGHGYVVVCIEHVYSNAAKGRDYVRQARGSLRERFDYALQRITHDPQTVLERPGDVSFAIDQAVEWNQGDPQLKGRIDTEKIAVLGHSFGAYTTLVACGAQPILDHLDPAVPPGEGLAGDLSDPRIMVGVAMSPQGPGSWGLGAESYGTIDRPLLCFSGSNDDMYAYDGSTLPATVRLQAFEALPPGDKYFLWLDKADHFSFADNPKAHLFPPPARADTQRILQPMTLAFCDAYLKDGADAKARLTEDYANSLCGDVVTQVTWYEK